MDEKNGHAQDFVGTHLPQHPIQKRKALIVELQGMVSPAIHPQGKMYAHALVLNASERRLYQSPGIDISSCVNVSE